MQVGIFQVKVDTVALNIPHYFDVIPRATARDLTTIRGFLNSGKYTSVAEFEDDINLMINNALTFNPPGTVVNNIALDCEPIPLVMGLY